MPRIAIDIQPPYNTELFLWKITESVEELSGFIPDGKELLDKARNSFKSDARRKEWLAVRALLQSTPYSNYKITYSTNGAPKLDSNKKHISISHTKEFVALAISDERVGIDFEREERNALNVAKLFLKEKEYEKIDNDRNEALRLWTVKEASFKLASENAVVIKDIETEFKSEENGIYIYNVKYPNGKNAICRTYMTGGLFISVSSLT